MARKLPRDDAFGASLGVSTPAPAPALWRGCFRPPPPPPREDSTREESEYALRFFRFLLFFGAAATEAALARATFYKGVDLAVATCQDNSTCLHLESAGQNNWVADADGIHTCADNAVSCGDFWRKTMMHRCCPRTCGQCEGGGCTLCCVV